VWWSTGRLERTLVVHRCSRRAFQRVNNCVSRSLRIFSTFVVHSEQTGSLLKTTSRLRLVARMVESEIDIRLPFVRVNSGPPRIVRSEKVVQSHNPIRCVSCRASHEDCIQPAHGQHNSHWILASSLCLTIGFPGSVSLPLPHIHPRPQIIQVNSANKGNSHDVARPPV